MKAYLAIAALALAGLASGAAQALQDHALYGAIAEKWAKLNGTAGPLGAPRSSEADTADGRGRTNAFEHGFISWRRGTDEAFAVYGLIGEKWNRMGRERGFGFPTTDELAGPAGGRYNHFERGGTISWHRDSGTHAVYGAIAAEWIDHQYGLTPDDLCGYPTSDEYQWGVYRRSDFQRGHILLAPGATRAQAHCPGKIDDGTELHPVHG